jgi:hypothetical protein
LKGEVEVEEETGRRDGSENLSLSSLSFSFVRSGRAETEKPTNGERGKIKRKRKEERRRR